MEDQIFQGGATATAHTADQLKEHAKDIVDQGQNVAGQVLEHGQQLAGQAVGKAKDQVMGQINSRKDSVISTLDLVAEALTMTSSTLREKGETSVGQYGDRAAEQVTKVSTYLRDHEVGDLVQDAATLARQKPALVLGTALALGLVAARFLKSSAPSVTGTGYDRDHTMMPYTGSGIGTEKFGASDIRVRPTYGV